MRKKKIDTESNNIVVHDKFNPFVPRIEISEPAKFDINVLEKMRGKIILQPDFQRNFIWPVNRQKELIKSLYRKFPLPLFYFAQKSDGNLEVIDGQQRLTTIFGFLNPKLVPKDIRRKLAIKIELRDHNNNKISLDELKRIVRNERSIHYVKINDNDLDPARKFEIFQALNTGASPLKPQEIRNCIFQGEAPYLNNALKKNAKKLTKLLNANFSRMEGEEYVLRFLMINSRPSRPSYNKDVSELLNNMTSIKNELTKERIKDLSKKFKIFVQRLKKLFPPKKNFEPYFQVLKKDVKLPAKLTDASKYPFSGKINQGLFHLFSYYLPQYDNNQFNKLKLKKTQRGFLMLLQNKEFISNVTGAGTNSLKKIEKSKDIFEKEFVKKYLGDPTNKNRRNISPQEKKTLFASIPYCYLCYGKIRDISHAAGEHIKPFDSGNDSELENILLAHKKCNGEKKIKMLKEYRDTSKCMKRRTKNSKNIPDYLKCLKDWHESYRLDLYKDLRRYALSDQKL